MAAGVRALEENIARFYCFLNQMVNSKHYNTIKSTPLLILEDRTGNMLKNSKETDKDSSRTSPPRGKNPTGWT